MRKLKEAARLLLEFKLGVRPIARACNISTSTAHAYVDRLKELDVPYGEIAAMGDDELEELLFPKEERRTGKAAARLRVPLEGDDKKGRDAFSSSTRSTRRTIPTATSEAGSMPSTVTGQRRPIPS